MRTQPPGHDESRDVDTSGDHHVVEPADDLEAPALVDAREVLGAEPAVDQNPRGQLRVHLVAVEQHRPRISSRPSSSVASRTPSSATPS